MKNIFTVNGKSASWAGLNNNSRKVGLDYRAVEPKILYPDQTEPRRLPGYKAVLRVLSMHSASVPCPQCFLVRFFENSS